MASSVVKLIYSGFSNCFCVFVSALMAAIIKLQSRFWHRHQHPFRERYRLDLWS